MSQPNLNGLHVFTTDAGQEGGYAVINGVRPYAEKISVGYYGNHPKDVGRSRYIDRAIRLELPKRLNSTSLVVGSALTESEARWTDRVFEYCVGNGVTAIVPTTDSEVFALSKSVERFRDAGITVPLPQHDLIQKMMDKLEAPLFLKEAGLPVPEVRKVSDVADALEYAQIVGYPVVVKERLGYFSAGVTLARGELELISATTTALNKWDSVVVQEYVPGSQEPSLLIASSPKGIANEVYVVRKRRYIQASFSTCLETMASIPELQSYLDFAKRLRIPGILVVQLKKDARDGSHRLMELNFRFGANSRMLTRMAMQHGFNPVMASLQEPSMNSSHQVFPAGKCAVSPVEDILALATYARARLRSHNPDNPVPVLRKMLQSYANTYFASEYTVDWFAANLLRDRSCAIGSYRRNLPQVTLARPDFIPWGDVVNHA